MEQMNYQELLAWYGKFNATWGNLRVRDKWFEIVSTKHETLRKKLGGNDFTAEISLENQEPQAPYSEIATIATRIYNTIPDYFVSNNITAEALCCPIVGGENNNRIKRSKHVNAWMERYGVYSGVQESIQKLMSQLGDIWAKYKPTDMKLYMALCTDARAFVKIGHNGCDNSSCYRQGGCHQMDKYALGQYPNSFVLLVFDSQDKMDRRYDIAFEGAMSRYWGIADESCNVFNICNHYLMKFAKISNMNYAMRKFFGKLIDSQKIIRTEDNLHVSGIYQNKKKSSTVTSVVNWSLYPKDKVIFKPQYFEVSVDGTSNAVMCHGCNGYFEAREFSASGLCQSCQAKNLAAENERKAKLKPRKVAVSF